LGIDFLPIGKECYKILDKTCYKNCKTQKYLLPRGSFSGKNCLFLCKSTLNFEKNL